MNLFGQLNSLSSLEESWEKIYNSKPYKIRNVSRGFDDVSIEDFEKNRKDNIRSILDELKCGKYRFSPLKGIFIEKKDKGKYRLLSVPTVKDRIVHKALQRILSKHLSRLLNTGVSYSRIPPTKKTKGLNLKSAASELVEHVKQKKFWIFESDIEGFFDNVSKQKLLEKIKSLLGTDRSIDSLIEQIIYFDLGNREALKTDKRSKEIQFPGDLLGISQGSSLSPLFSNIYLRDFDLAMKSRFDQKLIRYVDDFIIMDEDENRVQEAGKFAEEVLAKDLLNLKESKTHPNKNLKIDDLDFLGLKFTRRSISLASKKNDIIKSLNKKLNFEYKEVIRNKKKITKVDQMNERIQGWGETYRYYHVENLFAHLDKLIDSKRGKNPSMAKLKSLKAIKLSPLIQQKKWEELFK